MRKSLKANDGRYIAVVEYRNNDDIRSVRMEEANAIKFAECYKAFVVINGATGSLVKEVGPISDRLWDVVEEKRRLLREAR